MGGARRYLRAARRRGRGCRRLRRRRPPLRAGPGRRPGERPVLRPEVGCGPGGGAARPAEASPWVGAKRGVAATPQVGGGGPTRAGAGGGRSVRPSVRRSGRAKGLGPLWERRRTGERAGGRLGRLLVPLGAKRERGPACAAGGVGGTRRVPARGGGTHGTLRVPQPVPTPDRPLRKETSPNIHPKSPLARPEAVSSRHCGRSVVFATRCKPLT